jgi:hypothetical protein
MANPMKGQHAEARDAYLAEHPEPGVLDFHCSRCKAKPGEECRGRAGIGEHHAPRVDQHIRAFNLRQLDAANAGDNRLNELEGLSYRGSTEHHVRYMQRVCARIPKED